MYNDIFSDEVTRQLNHFGSRIKNDTVILSSIDGLFGHTGELICRKDVYACYAQLRNFSKHLALTTWKDLNNFVELGVPSIEFFGGKIDTIYGELGGVIFSPKLESWDEGLASELGSKNPRDKAKMMSSPIMEYDLRLIWKAYVETFKKLQREGKIGEKVRPKDIYVMNQHGKTKGTLEISTSKNSLFALNTHEAIGGEVERAIRDTLRRNRSEKYAQYYIQKRPCSIEVMFFGYNKYTCAIDFIEKSGANLEKDTVLVFGDSVYDLEMARATKDLGCQNIYFHLGDSRQLPTKYALKCADTVMVFPQFNSDYHATQKDLFPHIMIYACRQLAQAIIETKGLEDWDEVLTKMSGGEIL